MFFSGETLPPIAAFVDWPVTAGREDPLISVSRRKKERFTVSLQMPLRMAFSHTVRTHMDRRQDALSKGKSVSGEITSLNTLATYLGISRGGAENLMHRNTTPKPQYIFSVARDLGESPNSFYPDDITYIAFAVAYLSGNSVTQHVATVYSQYYWAFSNPGTGTIDLAVLGSDEWLRDNVVAPIRLLAKKQGKGKLVHLTIEDARRMIVRASVSLESSLSQSLKCVSKRTEILGDRDTATEDISDRNKRRSEDDGFSRN